MTEAEWKTGGKPDGMLQHLLEIASDRKLRLFILACARRVLPKVPDYNLLAAFAVAERYADGLERKVAIKRARSKLRETQAERAKMFAPFYLENVRSVPVWYALSETVSHNVEAVARTCAWSSTRTMHLGSITMGYPREELAAQAQLLRDIFGNPFCPVTFAPAWLTSTAVGIARGVYDDRAFDRLPILADAFQDAGCEDADVLAHCRGDGPHVRGCWVVDGVLGKT